MITPRLRQNDAAALHRHGSRDRNYSLRAGPAASLPPGVSAAAVSKGQRMATFRCELMPTRRRRLQTRIVVTSSDAGEWAMKVRLQRLLETLKTSFWFVPLLMALASVALVLLMNWVDGRVPRLEGGLFHWLYVSGPSGARLLLATIASSSITVASVVFSITIVALSTASSQFGPRLLPNFMQQGATQIALGAFIATFIYALLVLGQIPEQSTGGPLPAFSVALGLFAGVASFAVLVYFIHHVATFIQAPRIIDDVARSLEAALESVFPEGIGEGRGCTTDDEILRFARADGTGGDPVRRVSADRSGYLQAVDGEGLMALAAAASARIVLDVRPGNAVTRGGPVAAVYAEEPLPDGFDERLNEALVVGPERTPTQDIEYAVDQLAEVAMRALSPGINDPFTATNCIDRLGNALALLADRSLPSAERRDDDGVIRLIVRPYTYRDIVNAAFGQLRETTRSHVTVTLRILDAIERVAQLGPSASLRDALAQEAALVVESASDAAGHPADRERLAARHSEVVQTLGGG